MPILISFRTYISNMNVVEMENCANRAFLLYPFTPTVYDNVPSCLIVGDHLRWNSKKIFNLKHIALDNAALLISCAHNATHWWQHWYTCADDCIRSMDIFADGEYEPHSDCTSHCKQLNALKNLTCYMLLSDLMFIFCLWMLWIDPGPA